MTKCALCMDSPPYDNCHGSGCAKADRPFVASGDAQQLDAMMAGVDRALNKLGYAKETDASETRDITEITDAMIAAFEKSWTEITMPARKGPQRIREAVAAMLAAAPQPNAAPQAQAGRADVNQATPGSPTGNAVAAPDGSTDKTAPAIYDHLAERVTEFVRRAINDRWMKAFGPVWGDTQEAMYAEVKAAITEALRGHVSATRATIPVADGAGAKDGWTIDFKFLDELCDEAALKEEGWRVMPEAAQAIILALAERGLVARSDRKGNDV